MTTYTPNNQAIYLNAFSGAVTGMGVEGRIPIGSTQFDTPIAIADAFAKEFDSLIPSGNISSLQALLVYQESNAVWSGRSALSTPIALTPATYQALCTKLLDLINASLAFMLAQGTSPDIPEKNPPGIVIVRPLGGGADDAPNLTTVWAANAGKNVVWMAPGNAGEHFLIKTNPTVPNNLILMHYPGVVYEQQFVPGPPGTFQGTIVSTHLAGAFSTTLAANSVLGSPVLSLVAAPPVGTIVRVGNQAPSPLQKSLTYTVRSVAGAGPFNVTLDRPVLMNLVVGDLCIDQTFVPSNVRLYGNGARVIGNGLTFCQFAGGVQCYVEQFNIDGSNFFGGNIGALFDTACVDCTFDHMNVQNCAQGLRLAANEGCIFNACEVGNTAGVAIEVTDGYNCEILESIQYNAQTGLQFSSDGSTAGSAICRVDGGSFTNNTVAGIDIVGSSNDIEIDNVTCIANAVGLQNNTGGGGAPFNIMVGNIACERNVIGISDGGSPGMVVQNYTGFGNTSLDIKCTAKLTVVNANVRMTVQQTAAFQALTTGFLFLGNVRIQNDAAAQVHLRTDNTANIRCNQLDIVCNGINSQGLQLNNASSMDVISYVCSGTAMASFQASNVGNGCTLRHQFWNVDAAAIPILMGATAFSNKGTNNNSVVANGAAAVNVAWPNLRKTDTVVLTLKTLAGIAAPTFPIVTLTPGTGFSVTSVAGDTSTYTFAVL